MRIYLWWRKENRDRGIEDSRVAFHLRKTSSVKRQDIFGNKNYAE